MPRTSPAWRVKYDVVEFSSQAQFSDFQELLRFRDDVQGTSLPGHLAEHHLDQGLRGGLSHREPAHEPAIPQHRDRVCDLGEFLKTMGHVEDGHALAGQFPDQSEELLDLAFAQGRRGFVQHEHGRMKGHGLG